VPVMLDEEGRPVKRNFVHVDDLVDAILAAIDHPAAAADVQHLHGRAGRLRRARRLPRRVRGLPTVEVRTPYHSTWLDNAKAKFLLGWRPRTTSSGWSDEAWSYERGPTSRVSSGTPADVQQHGRPRRAQPSGRQFAPIEVHRLTGLRGGWSHSTRRRVNAGAVGSCGDCGAA
jgi:hypothetical protein